MIPGVLKGLLLPGTFPFFLMAATIGALLLFRKKNGGRAGRLWMTALVLLYWILSIPLTAVALVGALTPSYPPVQTRDDASGATAIVVLGAGMQTYRSRGDVYDAATREHALRMMEAARVYGVLDRPWVIVTGLGNERRSEAQHMARDLKILGVAEDRIVEESQAANTRDHASFVPPLLKARGVSQFVLVTSQQHIARSLKAFQAAGLHPIPSTPEFYVGTGRPFEMYLPSEAALEASQAMIYDQLAIVYYWLRGWV